MFCYISTNKKLLITKQFKKLTIVGLVVNNSYKFQIQFYRSCNTIVSIYLFIL